MAALVICATSCTKEDVSSTVVGNGEVVEVNFSANLSELGTRVTTGSGAAADRLLVNVFDAANGNQLSELSRTDTRSSKDESFNFSLPLVKGMTYDIVLWADMGDNSIYTLDGKVVTADYSAVKSNDENLDAFCFVFKGFDPTNPAHSPHFTLRRPFAQLNAATNDKAAVAASGIELTTSEVKVLAYNQFDIFEGTVPQGATKAEVSFGAANIPGGDLNGNATYEYLSANYLFVPATGALTDAEYTFKGKKTNSDVVTFTGTSYSAIPLKPNHRTNILGALLTKPADFVVDVEAGFTEPAEDFDAHTQIFEVSTAAELAAALTTKVNDCINNLKITLLNDIDLPISSLGTITGGSGEYKVGKVDTGNITLNLNGKRLNITTTYWSALGAKNDNALFTIKNGTMTSTGNSANTWNAWDLRFSNCNYVFEDVVFEKAVAIDNAGKNVELKNVTINETHDYYAMWITAEGQNVNIDGLTINSAGRGIKIDEQYVDAPKKVTLNITNATFTTANKAAILVKSAAGAKINASNLNITNVTADSQYAVWVDEDAAAYYNLVEVTGAQMRLEGSAVVTSQTELNAAIAAGKIQINLAAGTYTLPTNAKGTIIGTDKENVILNIPTQLRADNQSLTLQNLTTKVATGLNYTEHTFAFIHYYKQFNMINCNSDGRIRLNCYAANIEGCSFTMDTSSGFDGYAIFYYGPANSTVNVKDCVFNTAGKAIVVFSESAKAYNLNVDNCQFASSNASTDKAAIQMHTESGIYGVLKINDCKATGFAAVNGGLWNEVINSSANIYGAKAGDFTNNFEKWVNGVQVYNDYTFANGVYNIYTAAGLAYAATTLYKIGATINIEKDIDMTGVAYAPIVGSALLTVDGKGHTISNLKMEGVTQAALFADQDNLNVKNLTIANSTFVGKNVDGEDSAAAFVGFVEKLSSTESKIENCHVIGCTIGSAKYTGGLVGFKDGSGSVIVKDCSVKNSKIISKYTENNGALYKGHCGGLVGYYNNALTINNCTVENNTFDVLGARCGLFIGSAQANIAVSGSVKGNTGLTSLTGEINKITDWSNVNVQ